MAKISLGVPFIKSIGNYENTDYVEAKTISITLKQLIKIMEGKNNE